MVEDTLMHSVEAKENNQLSHVLCLIATLNVSLAALKLDCLRLGAPYSSDKPEPTVTAR